MWCFQYYLWNIESESAISDRFFIFNKLKNQSKLYHQERPHKNGTI